LIETRFARCGTVNDKSAGVRLDQEPLSNPSSVKIREICGLTLLFNLPRALPKLALPVRGAFQAHFLVGFWHRDAALGGALDETFLD
jgi:hypothetical protein